MSAVQYELTFSTDKPLQQEFDAWIQTAGGRHIAKEAYRLAAGYAERYRRAGKMVSMRLIWYLLRDRIDMVRLRASRIGIDLRPWRGYALNDHHTPYMARHILAHKPDWKGMFELREIAVERPARKALVVPIREGERRTA